MVAVLVAPGDTVLADDPLVVLESMKMETVITAPVGGTIHAVPASVSRQVEAGEPLVQLQPPKPEDHAARSPRLDLAAAASRPGLDGQGPGESHRDPVTLRGYLLGYDIGDRAARELSTRLEAALNADPADPLLLRQEQELLEIFADLTALARRQPDEAADEHSRSAQDYLFTYLACLDPERGGLSEHFRGQLRAALAHYGVRSLQRTPELEQVLPRMYRSLTRISVCAPVITAILDRWLRGRGGVLTGERLKVIDRLIACTQGRQQEVCGLAREVRFSYVDAPLLKDTRAQVYTAMGRCLDELAAHPSQERIRALTDRLVWCPQPMRALLRDCYLGADAAVRVRLLQARTRRFYRIRALRDLRCQAFGPYLTCLASYAEDGQVVDLVTGYVSLADLPDFARQLRGFLGGLPRAGVSSWMSSPGGPPSGWMPGPWRPSWLACSRAPILAVGCTASTSRSPVRAVPRARGNPRSTCAPSTSLTSKTTPGSPRSRSTATCTR